VLVALITALLIVNRRRKNAEMAALLSEARFRVLVEQAPEAIIVTDVDSELTVDANKNAFKLFACETFEHLSNRVERYFLSEQPDNLPLSESMLDHRIRALAGEEVKFERAIRNEKGENLICEVRLTRLPSAEHRLLRASWIDVTERKKAEKIMAASLREKEILLREIHHRVKNNLQIISSLLSLQGQAIDNPDVLKILKDSQGRVMSMALIHEQLYRSLSLGSIDIHAYLHDLLPRLVSTLKGSRNIVVQMDIPTINLSLEQAIPFGLILNELITNSLKHAFKGREVGLIEVSATVAGEDVDVIIADNGTGLPADFSLGSVSSLGLQIATMLTDQLKGRICAEPFHGACFRIKFPLHRDKKPATAPPSP